MFDEMTMMTSHATISVLDNKGTGTPVVFIHGNSLSKEMFLPQFEAFGDNRRIVALELPGHGSSSDADDPRRTYSLEGYADCIGETLQKLGIGEAVVVGWSLGGHIGYELTERHPGLSGLMTVGSPPWSGSTTDRSPDSGHFRNWPSWHRPSFLMMKPKNWPRCPATTNQ